jgi:N-acyl-D-amino-acid deacylase
VSVLVRGGRVVVAHGEPTGADVLVDGGRIVGVGAAAQDSAANDSAAVIDADGRLVLPGFVDAHSHAGARVFDDDARLALLRQGVTTIVTGQDGVGPAPGDGSWAARYFGAIDGEHPAYDGTGIGSLLATYDGTVPLNVATLVPAGTVRQQVVGPEARQASPDEIDRMQELVRAGLAEGAVGLSTGLDYVPGLYADEDELVALCRVVAEADGVYVTHMRGGYETNVAAGLDEVAAIARRSGVRAHVSHLHADGALAREALKESGVPMTFDAYPYSRGCTLLAMMLLPPELAEPGTDVLADALDRPGGAARVRQAILDRVLARPDLGPGWADQVTLSHIADPAHAAAGGRTLADAAGAAGLDPATFALEVLRASRSQVTAVIRVPHPRTPADLLPLYGHDGHAVGSDGILVGAHPHPRATGTFPRWIADYVSSGAMPWSDAVRHLSTTAVEVHRLGDRGRIAVGAVADIVLVDETTVAPGSDYASPWELARGIDDVLVAGVPVLADGALTGATPGRGLRRS